MMEVVNYRCDRCKNDFPTMTNVVKYQGEFIAASGPVEFDLCPACVGDLDYFLENKWGIMPRVTTGGISVTHLLNVETLERSAPYVGRTCGECDLTDRLTKGLFCFGAKSDYVSATDKACDRFGPKEGRVE